jgi:hypothetical protein
MRTAAILFVVIPSIAAFAPRQVTLVARQQQQQIRFASSATPSSTFRLSTNNDLDEEVERMVQQEVAKSNRMSNLRNEKGIDYAPW